MKSSKNLWKQKEQLLDLLERHLKLDSEWARVDPIGYEEMRNKLDAETRAAITANKKL